MIMHCNSYSIIKNLKLRETIKNCLKTDDKIDNVRKQMDIIKFNIITSIIGAYYNCDTSFLRHYD